MVEGRPNNQPQMRHFPCPSQPMWGVINQRPLRLVFEVFHALVVCLDDLSIRGHFHCGYGEGVVVADVSSCGGLIPHGGVGGLFSWSVRSSSTKGNATSYLDGGSMYQASKSSTIDGVAETRVEWAEHLAWSRDSFVSQTCGTPLGGRMVTQ